MTNDILRFCPAVFMVDKDYQIIFMTTVKGVGWIEIGEERFFNEEGGLLRWDHVQRICIPGEVLNRAKSYTIVFREYQDRPAYFPEGIEQVRKTYSFTPYERGDLCIFQFADTHGDVKGAVETYQKAKPCNILLLNGDIISSCEGPEEFDAIFALIENTVGGNYPIICSRGNHDTRGRMAQDLLDYTPAAYRNGRRETFYTVRQGDLWALVLDCGEDKLDSHAEYGGMVNFAEFRKRETKYLEELIQNKETEYATEGVRYRIAICHIPFVVPGKLESDTYDYWIRLLNEMGIDLMISGHIHRVYAIPPRAEGTRNAAFPTAILSNPNKIGDDGKAYFVGGIIYGHNGELTFESVPNGEIGS